jgi:transcriptional regulator with XRE-family HTH domain
VADEPMEAFNREVGRRLAWAREAIGVSQSECARRLDSNQASWSKYEAGTRLPPPYIMAGFCDLYGVSLDWIYRGLLIGLSRELQAALVQEHPELRRQ